MIEKIDELMKKQKLSCEKARNISIVKTLEKLGYFPKKELQKEAWFLSPFRSETQVSFKVDLRINRWYDHGEGIGGNVIDLVTRIKGCDVSGALIFLNNDITSSSFHQQPKKINNEVIKKNKIIKIKNIEHPALIEYLESRYIPIEIARMYCVEIHYKQNNKIYFAIAFKNDKGGYELRNKYYKGCIGNKSVTTFKNPCDELLIFEGFFDFLSYKALYDSDIVCRNEDYIICNSTALVEFVIPRIKEYKVVYSLFDNDVSGEKATRKIKESRVVIDCRVTYSANSDLNEYLCQSIEGKEGGVFMSKMFLLKKASGTRTKSDLSLSVCDAK